MFRKNINLRQILYLVVSQNRDLANKSRFTTLQFVLWYRYCNFWGDHCTTPPFSTNSAVNCIIFVNCDGNQVKQNIFSPWFIPQLLYPINCLKNAVCERNIDPCFKQDLLALSCSIFRRWSLWASRDQTPIGVPREQSRKRGQTATEPRTRALWTNPCSGIQGARWQDCRSCWRRRCRQTGRPRVGRRVEVWFPWSRPGCCRWRRMRWRSEQGYWRHRFLLIVKVENCYNLFLSCT